LEVTEEKKNAVTPYRWWSIVLLLKLFKNNFFKEGELKIARKATSWRE